VDVLVPNEHEARDLCGIYPADEQSSKGALEAILALGAKRVLITLGERGCVYSEGDGAVFCPAIKTVAVDTTSAGDSFIGALCASLCEGKTFEESVRYATKVSSITVSRRGASDSIPYADEVK
jgi:ribokinase